MADQPNKAPALPWYPRDFAGDEPVQLMTLEEEGAYRRLLDHQWLHGSIPADLKQIAKVCKNVAVPKMRRLWPAMASLFAPTEDASRLQNGKLERVREEWREYRGQKSTAGKLGAAARWQKNGTNDGEDDGSRMADPVADEWPAYASAAVRQSPKNGSQPKKPPPAARPHGGWTAVWAAVYHVERGNIDPGRIGKRCADVRTQYGEKRSLEMWACFCHDRRHFRFGKLDQEHFDPKYTGDLRNTTPEDFAQSHVFWNDYTPENYYADWKNRHPSGPRESVSAAAGPCPDAPVA